MNKKEKKIYDEGQKRFEICHNFEDTARSRWRYDRTFHYGDTFNRGQWDPDVVNARTTLWRPILTENKVALCNLAIIQQLRENRPEIKVLAIDGPASHKAANAWGAAIKRIQTKSHADDAFDTAAEHQVVSGLGWVRLITKYVPHTYNEQEILIERIIDPLTILIDPNCIDEMKQDMKYAFIFRKMTRDDFEFKYPSHKNIPAASSGFNMDSMNDNLSDSWKHENFVEVMEYWRKVPTPNVLHMLDDGRVMKENEAKKEGVFDDLFDKVVQSRNIVEEKVEMHFIAGSEIIETTEWLGDFIPLVPFIGRESNVNGIHDFRGHTRGAIDSQREHNFGISLGLEQLSKQTQSPWLIHPKTIEQFKREWQLANILNSPWLPYIDKADDGSPLPKPEKIEPPTYSPGYLDLIKVADAGMEMSTGQYGPTFGEPTNERSGKAVDARHNISNANLFYFVENQAKAMRALGEQIVNLFPHIYDTERTMKMIGMDGAMMTIKIDPNHPAAHGELQGLDDESFSPDQVAMIFNPNVGEYQITCDVGQGYASNMQEAFEAVMDVAAREPALFDKYGDLIWQLSDTPYMDKFVERAKKLLPPNIINPGPDPKLVEAQQQIAMQHGAIVAKDEEIKKLGDKTTLEWQQKAIDQQEADARTLGEIIKGSPEAGALLAKELASRFLGMAVNDLIHAHKVEDLASQQMIQEIAQANGIQQEGQQDGGQPSAPAAQ